MKQMLLNFLRCPVSGLPLKLEAHDGNVDDIQSGWLVSEDGLYRYPMHNGIPRFVPTSNYADNFGLQWNHFRQTQLDSYSGHPISAKRFWQATGWQPQELKHQWVLDVGCGAGRFAEIALEAGAYVVALDYSNAVDACYKNLKHHPNLHIVQGDIYALPFAAEIFPYIYSLGMLQHTPDVGRAFASLPEKLQKEGKLCVDYYEKTWKRMILPKYWLRPVMKRLPKPVLLSILQKTVPIMLQCSRALAAVPVAGVWLKRLIPVSNHDSLPLTPQQRKEWSLLDTFDWFSPEYDHPQSAATAKSWMLASSLNNVEILRIGHLVARGKK